MSLRSIVKYNTIFITENKVRKTGQKPPGPFLFRGYPIICTPCHGLLYNTPDTFLLHIVRMKTWAGLLDPRHPSDQNP